MGWEKRGSGQYYYRKKRVNGRVVSEYAGSGILAEATQMLDQIEKEKTDLEKTEQQIEKEQAAAIDQAIDQNLESIGELIKKGRSGIISKRTGCQPQSACQIRGSNR